MAALTLPALLARRFKRPVRATVRGGYTVSGLQNCRTSNSPESLVTCILKADLGGLIGEHRWLGAAAKSAGLVDSFMERMLMAVILIKVFTCSFFNS